MDPKRREMVGIQRQESARTEALQGVWQWFSASASALSQGLAYRLQSITVAAPPDGVAPILDQTTSRE